MYKFSFISIVRVVLSVACRNGKTIWIFRKSVDQRRERTIQRALSVIYWKATFYHFKKNYNNNYKNHGTSSSRRVRNERRFVIYGIFFYFFFLFFPNFVYFIFYFFIFKNLSSFRRAARRRSDDVLERPQTRRRRHPVHSDPYPRAAHIARVRDYMDIIRCFIRRT